MYKELGKRLAISCLSYMLGICYTTYEKSYYKGHPDYFNLLAEELVKMIVNNSSSSLPKERTKKL